MSSTSFPNVPHYNVPFKTGPCRLSMGLMPLDLTDWIASDSRMETDLDEKERLLSQRHNEVFAALPEAAESSQEVLELLVAHLPVRFPALYQRMGDRIANCAVQRSWSIRSSDLHALDIAGRLVQEDLCLMQPFAGTNQYRLVGGSVCFPTRWQLQEKMGLSLDAIHGPVPGYEKKLGATMDRFFTRLKVSRPVWRINWSLMDDPTLFQPRGHDRCEVDPTITVDNVGDRVWLRVERQTLRRLPRTYDILFTVRIYVQSLKEIALYPNRPDVLAAAIRALSPEMYHYKSLGPFADVVLDWLDRLPCCTS